MPRYVYATAAMTLLVLKRQSTMRFPIFKLGPDECNDLAVQTVNPGDFEVEHKGGDGSGSNVWVYRNGEYGDEGGVTQLIIALGGNEEGVSQVTAVLIKSGAKAAHTSTFTLTADNLNNAVARLAANHAPRNVTA